MASDAVGIFYSYFHKDEKLRDKLPNHLSILKRQGAKAHFEALRRSFENS